MSRALNQATVELMEGIEELPTRSLHSVCEQVTSTSDRVHHSCERQQERGTSPGNGVSVTWVQILVLY